MSFDPNALEGPKQPEWATYIDDRRPKFKMHSNRGKALNAASYASRQVQIFRWDFEDSKWIEVFNGKVTGSWARGTSKDTCDRCGNSTIKEQKFNRSTSLGGHEQGVRRYNAGSWGWLATPENKKRLVEPFQRAWLCGSCK